ncbi:hypothetical protein ASF61_03855 [Duganella sp. Leaf126]|uniref:hypothetical protein n=1 Tax=Duganella sp. Leaf126 TaxID=1736266 RepID=UPI0006F504C0|nr:hypothetical protein [Duganella sp. Leaf126]KQQ39957.1 hypothetical protein ASF61_03855 [Duganella sp. Leaf126]
MTRITLDIDIDDTELAHLRAAAQESKTDPSNILSAVVKQGLQQMRSSQSTYAVEDNTLPVSRLDLTGLTLEERRARRFAILQNSSGIWSGEPGMPRDGLVYQQALRAEWP